MAVETATITITVTTQVASTVSVAYIAAAAVVAMTVVAMTVVAMTVVAMTVVAMTVIVRTREIPRAVVAVIPGSGADKDTTDEVLRSVVTIRRARVWIVTVVSIRADRGAGHIARTDPNADSHLRRRSGRQSHQDPQQRKVF